MMSRQRMAESLNRSVGDDLDIDDVWFDETSLMDDHITGILDKYFQHLFYRKYVQQIVKDTRLYNDIQMDYVGIVSISIFFQYHKVF